MYFEWGSDSGRYGAILLVSICLCYEFFRMRTFIQTQCIICTTEKFMHYIQMDVLNRNCCFSLRLLTEDK